MIATGYDDKLHWVVQNGNLFKFFWSIRQNAELAKLRQDCIRLNKELVEKNEALQADEQLRKNLESKAAMAEKQLTQLQVRNSPFFAQSFLLFSLLSHS